MANLTPTAVNEINSVYRIEKTDVVLGGTGTNQIANKQAQSLVNTCKYLDNKLTITTNLANDNKNRLDNLITVPVGTILPFAGNTLPSGFLWCNGTNITGSEYATLRGVLGGATTTPLLNGRFLEGTTNSLPGNANSTQRFHDAGLPNITATMTRVCSGSQNDPLSTATGAFTLSSVINLNGYDGGGYGLRAKDLTLDASRSSSVYKDNVTTVQPSSYLVRYIIKY